MIKNIIFDLGNVLIKYSPESFLEKNVKKEKTYTLSVYDQQKHIH